MSGFIARRIPEGFLAASQKKAPPQGRFVLKAREGCSDADRSSDQ